MPEPPPLALLSLHDAVRQVARALDDVGQAADQVALSVAPGAPGPALAYATRQLQRTAAVLEVLATQLRAPDGG